MGARIHTHYYTHTHVQSRISCFWAVAVAAANSDGRLRRNITKQRPLRPGIANSNHLSPPPFSARPTLLAAAEARQLSGRGLRRRPCTCRRRPRLFSRQKMTAALHRRRPRAACMARTCAETANLSKGRPEKSLYARRVCRQQYAASALGHGSTPFLRLCFIDRGARSRLPRAPRHDARGEAGPS